MNGVGEKYLKNRVRATDYLVVAQLFLQNNFLLETPLTPDDIKPRLLGHWGTCHGINLAYANLGYFFETRHKTYEFILGPGHGFPALQANLFLDDQLGDEITLETLCKNFSWPEGFPSHASPLTPGVICEGGELGYALGTAYGSALGHPEKTVAVLLGDGEFETATTLASLNLVKLLATPENGAVLPILHLNGYKISAPTVPARKSERELLEQLRGFGFSPIVINGSPSEFYRALQIFESFYAKLYNPYANLETAYGLTENTCAKNPPFFVLKTEKGAGGPAYVKGQKIAGNYKSHQIPLPNAKTDEEELKILENWLKSYRFEELYNREKGFTL